MVLGFNTGLDIVSGVPLDPTFVKMRSCGAATTSGRNQSIRFRLDYDPEKHPSSAQSLFSTPEERGNKDDLPDNGLGPKPDAFWREKLSSDEVRVWNKHAHRARMVPLPINDNESSVINLFPATEYYHVDIERNYSRELPSISMVEGKLVLNKGFLQPWDDPDEPYHFFYSGLERYMYSWPERVIQATMTAVMAGLYIALYCYLYHLHPEAAVAGVVSWLRNSLSVLRVITLAVLAASDKMWIFWMLLIGKVLDGVLARYLPSVRNFAWFLLTLLIFYNVFTIAPAPPLPFPPFI
ncbi:hypothetical protein CEUSTIGMA_g9023.t1 [Chlamydomonas eustigma]|uniref:Uncharacterized protein n=1 Tax=Chlamydomonas eustigma TaxID=1157962 RepID=A0A250XEU3_9CHLO|nr:hypothetical protein CEUSTIGMA_g9023.t1 [Chlamydomonas eustigma]|eukprot:GAX81595.1 hypothetical protein CEUSTIGMA_g9023.t1 [Chlamydomonas eustigma]